ncbi:MAG TPA: trypsin-like serine protease [Fuerstia sp.]|nr:trypsin-like serine protease [Fuerstiella sp.]
MFNVITSPWFREKRLFSSHHLQTPSSGWHNAWAGCCFSLLVLFACSAPFAAAQEQGTGDPDDLADVAAVDTRSERSLPDLAKEVKQSLVVVHAIGRDRQSFGHGTGFVISSDGLIATARHVIGDRRPIRVELTDGTSLPVTHVHTATGLLDLVVLKVDATDLTPLSLGDSESVVVGQSVVVAGHPRGFNDSVHAGILSGRDDIEGISMLQLSVAIEPGSSGEPVIDRSGKVIGVVTLKSTTTGHLGFAIPVRHLKTMLDAPVPMPIKRWMTIGALDPKRWDILWDANWRQRAGRILVDGYGTAFGGRSLCLQPSAAPKQPFEIQVEVKLDEESGAAGLAFHADGDHRHYGFYPSAGKIRLTRFNGPDLNSWTILHNEPHPAYRPNDWNTFKVRIEENQFHCYVNDEPVVQSTDAELPWGRIGLVTFRGTSAGFRRFVVAPSIPSIRPTDDQRNTIARILDGVQSVRPASLQTIEQLMPLERQSALLIEQKAKALELRATHLRQMAIDVHAANVRQQILKALGQNPAVAVTDETKDNASENSSDSETTKPSPDLLKAALLIAVLDNAEVDPDVYIARVDQLAGEIRDEAGENATESERLEALDRILFEEYGFHGSHWEYYSKSNSYLNEVIDDREGLPITLSVLYIELARRLDLKVVGLGLPRRFVVRFEPQEPDAEKQIIDVFNRGQRLSIVDAEKIIRGSGESLRPEFFEGQEPVQVVQRMLINLLGLAESRRDNERVLRYLETLVAIDDSALEFRAKRLELRARTGRLAEAIDDANWFIREQPDGTDADRLYELRAEFQRQLTLQAGESAPQTSK